MEDIQVKYEILVRCIVGLGIAIMAMGTFIGYLVKKIIEMTKDITEVTSNSINTMQNRIESDRELKEELKRNNDISVQLLMVLKVKLVQ